MAELEAGHCFLCPPGTEAVVLAEYGGLRLSRCRCGLAFVDPRLTAVERARIYQQPGYFEGEWGYSSYTNQEPELRAVAARRLACLHKFARPPGRLLDVGCAYGYMLDAARQAGWEVGGVERSAHACEEASRRIGPGVVSNSDFSDADLPEGSFAVITMSHVLEHSADPLADLRRARDLLVRGGVLYIGVPNLLAMLAYRPGLDEQLVRPQYHLYHFAPAHLARAAAMAGLTIREVRTVGVHAAAVRQSWLTRLLLGDRAAMFELGDFKSLGLLGRSVVRAVWQMELRLCKRGDAVVCVAERD